MAITLRSVKGSALTHAEHDATHQALTDGSTAASVTTLTASGLTTVTNISGSAAEFNLTSSSKTWVLFSIGTSWSPGFAGLSPGYFAIRNNTDDVDALHITATGAVTIPGTLGVTGVLTATAGAVLGSFTVATRPAHAAGKTIYVTDGGAGAVVQTSTGSAWVNLG